MDSRLHDDTFGEGIVQLLTIESDYPMTQFVSDQYGEKVGFSVSLSKYAGTIAFGAVGDNCADGTDSSCGAVKIFVKSGEQFKKLLGNDIKGQAQDNLFGIDIDLTEDGRTIIATSIDRDNKAAVSVFEGNDVQNPNPMSAALSSNGNRAIFMTPNETDESSNNIVKVFERHSHSDKKGKRSKKQGKKGKRGKKSSKKSSKSKCGKTGKRNSSENETATEECKNDKTFNFQPNRQASKTEKM